MSQAAAGPGNRPVFTQGSTMRHVMVMTVTAAVGLMAVFFVDAITLFYISRLNDPAQTAAVGRASYVLALMIGISVGMMIGASVVVARSIGAGRDGDARSFAGSALIAGFVVMSLVAALLLVLSEDLLTILEAEGAAFAHALAYLHIVLPAMPFMTVGLVSTGLLRARGDARRAMLVTLLGGGATAILDPIFIFGLGLQVTGAAIVAFIVRVAFAAVGLYFVLVVHRMADFSGFGRLIIDARRIAAYAIPAMFTNLAAPFGAFLIARAVSEYGDQAIAGQAVVDRLIPLFFGVIFALSGAVGPIIGQNVGAGQLDRARQTLVNGLIFNVVYVSLAWLVLFLIRGAIIVAYAATGDMAQMINLFGIVLAGSFLFNGTLFVTNAAFNNLGRPLWATAFNWARQTVGVVPFVYFGAKWGGLTGIIWGASIGAVPFALLAFVTAFWLIEKMRVAQPLAAV
jgi:putative MATE family efflux protein